MKLLNSNNSKDNKNNMQIYSIQSLTKYAADLDGESVYHVSHIKDGILVIGNESKGISPAVMSQVNNRITIPQKGKAESLNAAVAAGIILSHVV
ncbi:MAG: hypothetical protein EOO01_21020 [Chitinophagaceae bacterium]|nr:MAG: hypothetical protein EOO01_21020 [Chitinophagaceae bacterium]